MTKKSSYIYIDGSPLVNNSQGGIGQYASNVIAELIKNPDYQITIVLFKDDKPVLRDIKGIKIEYLPIRRKVYMGLWRLFPYINVKRWLKHQPNWIIYPNFAMTPYIKTRNSKSISIIHDLTYLHYPKTMEWKNRFFIKMAVKRSLKTSDYIITPSEFTRKDILRNYSTTSQLLVAYPGYTEPKNSDMKPSVRSDKYLFYIGTIEPRKNVEALCNAYLLSDFSKEDIPLVIAGKRGWGSVTIPNHPNILYLGEVSNQERANLLDNCLAFVFPSLFEGFGMPVIEAMRHSKPTVVSSNSSLEEIVNKKNSYLINRPFNTKQIVVSLNKLHDDLRSNTFRTQKIVDEARKKSYQFTWEKCTEVFRRIIDNKTDN